MSPADFDGVFGSYKCAIKPVERIDASELSDLRIWRGELSAASCLEVVDRGVVVGYLLSPGYGALLNERLTELESQVERTQIAAMLEVRGGYEDVKTGEELKTDALAYFDGNCDALLKSVDDGSM